VLRRFVVPVLLVGIVAAGALAAFLASPAGAGRGSSAKVSHVARIAAKDAKRDAVSTDSLTARAVLAARAFEASLSSVQRATAEYPFDSPKKIAWSYYPTNLAPRSGVEVSDLSGGERARLWALLRTIMSPLGYVEEVGVRKADTYLRHEFHGGHTLAATFAYGEDRYFVAIFGTPSRSKPWTIEFTGHHYELTMTFRGASVSDTPYFIGANPPKPFKLDGKTYHPIADQVAALFAAVDSLHARRRATAQLPHSFLDVFMGPAMGEQFPPRQGITVSTLTAAQQKLVTRAIWAYVGVMPRAQADARMAIYEKQYSQTKLAWAGSTNATTPGAYVRIQGPRVWIELLDQDLGPSVGEGPNYHSLERDVKSDFAGSP
jgi:hypothetical protein